MVPTREGESTFYGHMRLACGVLVHVVCTVFTVCIAVLARPGASVFSWHPFLMSLAFSFFMTEAVLLFSPDCSLVGKLPHKTKGRYHWILQTLAAICAVLGLSAIFYNKHLNSKSHFSTWHGLLGLVAVCYAVIQSVGGVSLMYHKLIKGLSLAKLKRYHAASGLVLYLLGSSSLLLGMCSLWFTTSVRSLVWYFLAFCPILSSLVIMSQVTNSYIGKKQFQP
ncbi:transmembrane reductase CYB561D2 [Brienomyrus brachyistius]|uniref:transmembrane reductase CYB561D2 n=1 Tax=Brienomyrus brachyistius TaxID=42636 RepID=UPI0020B2937C|nr:transmembrane reductase CYB561D2 [Brienomyrus brachyistius]XP_048873341.1 transmembrane reductase CYB561D2 [Brienomyrus brachyistius]